MEGFGSGGQKQPGMATYGATKRAVTYLTEALVKETKDSNVKVGFLSPGIVATDLLVDDYDGQPEEFEKVKKIFNILGDRVETVTPWLAEQLLAADEERRPRRVADQAQGDGPLHDRRLQEARHLRSGGLPDGHRPVHRVRPGARARGLRPRAARRRRHRRPRPGRRPACCRPSLPAAARRRAGHAGRSGQGHLEAAGRHRPCRNYPFLENLLFPCLAFGFAGIACALSECGAAGTARGGRSWSSGRSAASPRCWSGTPGRC